MEDAEALHHARPLWLENYENRKEADRIMWERAWLQSWPLGFLGWGWNDVFFSPYDEEDWIVIGELAEKKRAGKCAAREAGKGKEKINTNSSSNNHEAEQALAEAPQDTPEQPDEAADKEADAPAVLKAT